MNNCKKHQKGTECPKRKLGGDPIVDFDNLCTGCNNSNNKDKVLSEDKYIPPEELEIEYIPHVPVDEEVVIHPMSPGEAKDYFNQTIEDIRKKKIESIVSTVWYHLVGRNTLMEDLSYKLKILIHYELCQKGIKYNKLHIDIVGTLDSPTINITFNDKEKYSFECKREPVDGIDKLVKDINGEPRTGTQS